MITTKNTLTPTDLAYTLMAATAAGITTDADALYDAKRRQPFDEYNAALRRHMFELWCMPCSREIHTCLRSLDGPAPEGNSQRLLAVATRLALTEDDPRAIERMVSDGDGATPPCGSRHRYAFALLAVQLFEMGVCAGRLEELLDDEDTNASRFFSVVQGMWSCHRERRWARLFGERQNVAPIVDGFCAELAQERVPNPAHVAGGTEPEFFVRQVVTDAPTRYRELASLLITSSADLAASEQELVYRYTFGRLEPRDLLERFALAEYDCDVFFGRVRRAMRLEFAENFALLRMRSIEQVVGRADDDIAVCRDPRAHRTDERLSLRSVRSLAFRRVLIALTTHRSLGLRIGNSCYVPFDSADENFNTCVCMAGLVAEVADHDRLVGAVVEYCRQVVACKGANDAPNVLAGCCASALGSHGGYAAFQHVHESGEPLAKERFEALEPGGRELFVVLAKGAERRDCSADMPFMATLALVVELMSPRDTRRVLDQCPDLVKEADWSRDAVQKALRKVQQQAENVAAENSTPEEQK